MPPVFGLYSPLLHKKSQRAHLTGNSGSNPVADQGYGPQVADQGYGPQVADQGYGNGNNPVADQGYGNDEINFDLCYLTARQ